MAPHTADGRLDLSFAAPTPTRTDLVARRWRFPLRTTVPMYVDPADPGMAFVYVQNPTGGVFADDHLVIDIDAGAGSRVHLTTQSATKVNRMEAGSATQSTHLRVGERAYVEAIPDVLIPQAGSRYTQSLDVTLAADASFVGTELVAPGRVGRSELFEYAQLRIETTIRSTRRTLATETIELVPGRRRPSQRGVLGARDYLGTIIAVTSRPGIATALASDLDAAFATQSDVRAAAGELPNGCGVIGRVLAPSAPTARDALDAGWERARRALAGLPLPPRRK